jgi:ABC-type multidrug transport system fused ATPase/permease subunit
MMVAAAIAAGICVASLAIGFVARTLAARPLPADGVLIIAAPDKWGPVARALLRPDWLVACLAIWLAFLDAVLALAAPWPLKVVVDYAVGHHPFPQQLAWMDRMTPMGIAATAAAAGLLLLLAGAVAGYLVVFLTSAVSERMTVRLRAAIIGHVLAAEPRSVAAYPLGELTSRLGGDAVRVTGTVAVVVEDLVPDVALLAGMTAVTAALDWRLTVVVLGIIPLYVLTARFRNRTLRGAQRQARARSGDLAAFGADLLARLPAVHVFDRGHDEAGRYGELAAASAQAEVAAVDAGARFAPVTDTLPGLGLAAALVTGTAEVAAGRLTLGGFLVFLAYLSSLTGPVRSLARLSATVARGGASRDRIAELLRLPPLRPRHPVATAVVPVPAVVPAPPLRPLPRAPLRPPLRPLPRPLPSARDVGPEVSVEQVCYTHRPGQQVLASASMRVPGGALACVTGPSGCGKSTLLSLLIRLADPQSGTIAIGGRDIAGIPLRDLRALVSLVPQDPWLHTGTIAENIGYGRPGASQAQIMAAAERAGVAAFADHLPDGYDTPVGAHGHQLSGGQQRRVAVARALLRDTPVLLLDEPTTGLDPSTEARLITDLLQVTRGKTVILVSHQRALITRAEHVFQMEAGRVKPAEAPALAMS